MYIDGLENHLIPLCVGVKGCNTIPELGVAIPSPESKMVAKMAAKRTRWWKWNEEELKDILISKAMKDLSKQKGDKQIGRRHILELLDLQMKSWESQHRESTRRKTNGSGMMQCSRWCLRKGGCSENGKEREKKTIGRGTGRQTKKAKGL